MNGTEFYSSFDPAVYHKDNNDAIDFYRKFLVPFSTYFSQFPWGNINLPIVTDFLNFDEIKINLFRGDLLSFSKENLKDADIIYINGEVFLGMFSQMLEVLPYLKDSEVVIGIKNSRKNTGFYYESFDFIIKEIEDKLKIILSSSDKIFIENNISDEYGLANIIKFFFQKKYNLKIKIFSHDEAKVFKDITEFFSDLELRNKPIFCVCIANGIFSYFQKIKYDVSLLEQRMSSHVRVEFVDLGLPLHHVYNLELIYIKMALNIMNFIDSQIDS